MPCSHGPDPFRSHPTPQDPTGIVEKGELVARVVQAAAAAEAVAAVPTPPQGYVHDPASGYWYSAASGVRGKSVPHSASRTLHAVMGCEVHSYAQPRTPAVQVCTGTPNLEDSSVATRESGMPGIPAASSLSSGPSEIRSAPAVPCVISRAYLDEKPGAACSSVPPRPQSCVFVSL